MKLRALLLALAVLSALAFYHIQDDHGKAALSAMIAGTAYQPYVRRLLAARLIWLVSLPGISLDTAALAVVCAGSMAAALGLWRIAGYRVALVFAASIPAFGHFAYAYDLPHAAIVVWFMAALQVRRWGWAMALFIIGLLSKETMMLFIPAFVVMAWGVIDTPRLIAWAWALFGVALAVNLALTLVFVHNPGAPMILFVRQNIAEIGTLPVYDLGGIALALILAAVIIASRPQSRLTMAWLACIPAFVVLWLVFGRVNEPRVFLEVWPGVAMGLVGRNKNEQY